MQLLTYLAQISLFWLLLYACYWLLLRRHTFFVWNRAYLLSSLLVAFALPLVEYPEAAPVIPRVVYEMAAPPTEPIPVVVERQHAASLSTAPATTPFPWVEVLWIVYALGVVIMAVRLVWHLRQVRALLRQGTCLDMDVYQLYLLDRDTVGSFSFLRHIVINRTDYEHNLDTILNHELIHVRQRHSWDILLVEVLRVLFWFNPVLILYKRSLQQVHEYLADREVCQWDTPRDSYANFMLSYALRVPAEPLVNSFFKSSLLKDRIMMLYKTKNSNWSLGRYAVVALLIGVVALLVASCDQKPANSEKSIVATNQRILIEGIVLDQDNEPLPGAEINVKGSQTGTSTTAQGQFRIIVPAGSELDFNFVGHKPTSLQVDEEGTLEVRLAEESLSEASIARRISSETGRVFVQEVKPQLLPNYVKDSVYTVVKQNPVFPGGLKAMYKFIEDNIRYPAAAQRANVQGKVFLTFVVNADGSVQDIQVLKGMGFGTDEEAIRVMKNTPKWKPGQNADGEKVRVKYNLPITFVLPEEKDGSASLGESKVNLADATHPTSANAQVDSLIRSRLPLIPKNFGIRSFRRGFGFASSLAILLPVVDGVVTSINNVDPNTIDKLEILKGEKATELYGLRGSNGVLLITTKQGAKMPLNFKK